MANKILIPTDGAKIEVASDFSLKVPDNPIIPFIEGDGIGVDITPVMRKVVDAAVKIAYSGGRKIHWLESFCGEKATREYGPDIWLPEETLEILSEFSVSIKAVDNPCGWRIRSLNVALRQQLDLFVCLRPVRYFKGVLALARAREYGYGYFPREFGRHLCWRRVRIGSAEAKS